MAKDVKYKADDLVGMIRAKYSGSAYCVLEQVADGTGAGTGSWIDAAVFTLWPSNGIWRSACEVKVSRSDFINELARPAKNEWARTHFDFFWYVVAPGVAKDGEIPEGCGLMAIRGGGLSVVKQAPRRASVTTDAGIVASFARSLDKERIRFMAEALKEAKESDPEVITAIAFKQGVDKYLRALNQHSCARTADDVFKALMQTQVDKASAIEAEHTIGVLEDFKQNALRFLLQLAPLAAEIITARDETAEFIVSRYGRTDAKSLDALKAAVKSNDIGRWGREDARALAETAELLASMK